jgi:2-keto-4-pentenoate hydratase/2-oxohepta-3-ene-1,7-dioic acid hydratase in catechol pathway
VKYASFVKGDGTPAFGRVEGERIIALGGASDLKSALAGGALESLPEAGAFDLAQVRLAPPIPNPGKILCIGLNYQSHREETGRGATDHPVIFTRFADTLVADGAPLVRPDASEQFDYEGELAVVIGRAGRAIDRAHAFDHVAGYACFNDASVRDWQRHTGQFTPGKNFPGTGGFGPFMVTPAAVADLQAERVTTRLNGQIVQDQPISDMIFPVDELIAYISTFTPLGPGDVIVTGTPGGVGMARNPPLWMKPGDMVEVEIGVMGRLRNPVAGETR